VRGASAGSRWRDLADRQDITDVLNAYCECLDRMDLDALVELFTADCSVDYGTGPWLQSTGRDALRRNLQELWRWSRTSHHLSNVSIEIAREGEGARARALSYVLAWHEAADGSTATMMGRYEDRLRKEGGRWWIACRRQLLMGNDEGFDVRINPFRGRIPPGTRSPEAEREEVEQGAEE
jgi:ketosteroid isomerase-like protein